MKSKLLLFFVISCFSGTPIFAQKPKITKLEEMPTFTYEIPVKPSEFVQQDAFDRFAGQVAADFGGVLEKYDISDNTTLKDIYGVLLSRAIIAGEGKEIIELVQKRRALEEKPADKLLSGMTIRILAESWLEENSLDADEVRDTFRNKLTKTVNSLPWDVVQDQIEQTKGSLEILSQNVFIGLLQSQIDPAFEKSGHVSGEAAKMMLRVRSSLDRTLDFRMDIVEIFDAYIQANRIEKPDIWAERSVNFDGTEGYSPVLVGIWDSGIDADVFGERMWANQDEKVDGQDNDGNGFVDDVHGIAFDLKEHPTPELLYPLSREQADKLPGMKDQMKGLDDLQASIDSEEAKKLRQYMASLPPEEMRPFLEELLLFAVYMHGTHVAGIAVDGNPYAGILGARITFDHRQVPAPPTVELARRASENYKKTVEYFQKQGVRVVNMSWSWTFSEIERMLEVNGIGKDAAERREKTRAIFNIYKEGLYRALEGAPDILFVTSAGNDDNNVDFDQVIPSSYDLPNLLVVGAVDQAGEETSFTSFGEQVTLHANGFEVDSYLPGGSRMKASGTSMASPNAVNLIAKLLAVNPDLTPADVIGLVEKAVDKSEDGRIFLINPQKSMDLLMGTE